MPSPSSIPRSSSASASAPNLSNIGRRLPHGLQRPSGLAPPVAKPANKNRPNRLVRTLLTKKILRKRTNNGTNLLDTNLLDFSTKAGVIATANSRTNTLDIISLHEQKFQNGILCNKDCSPYYRGLLSRPALSPYSPERTESHIAPSNTTTAFTKASFASSIMVKIQGFTGACLAFRSKKEDHNHDHKATPSAGLTNSTTANRVTSTGASSSSSYYSAFPSPSPAPPLLASDMIITEEALAKEKKSVAGITDERGTNSEKKPLRESRVSAGLAHDEAMSLPDQQIISPLEKFGHADQKDILIDDRDRKLMDGEREFLWADKYRPKALEDFICNRSKAIQLQALERKGHCGHFIFEGAPGVGKRTMIWAMIREAFGPDSVKGEVEGLGVTVLVKESPRLVEVNLSDLKGHEKHVIFELIKETSDLKASNRSALPCNPSENCRAIIFYGVDKLSTDAILYVKWLLERYTVCSKIFFCCTDLSKLQAIKDICTVVQLLPPSRTEIIEVLNFIAEKEGIELPHQLAEKITDTSKNNLRQAIRSLEATWLKHYPFTEDQEVLTGWEDDIANIAKNMVHEQSPKLLYIIRGKLKSLKEHDVPSEFIFQSLVEELKKHLHDLLKRRVHNLYVEYSMKDDQILFESTDKAIAQQRKNDVQQQFMRIEEFIAKFMSCYKAESAKLEQQTGSSDHNNEA
ncbi:hypothetical protein L484_023856 [Morus notabilis]|uniref:Replication factor C subunit 3 n=1 Tax=Morus notabilis TaxID=981085 RepID=W9RDG8_9ROSA|nr:uncharacterized protein LOC21406609 [Morus notabilis]EXB70670.1 hypothetical protein L484_023856 [Morus notabilis]